MYVNDIMAYGDTLVEHDSTIKTIVHLKKNLNKIKF